MYHTMTGTKFSFYESSSSPADVMKDKDDKMEVATVGSTVATSYSDECWATSTIPSNAVNSITSTREENLPKAKAEAAQKEEAIKENVYGFLNRMQEVKTDTQIQMSVSVSGKKLKTVEIATALKQLVDEGKVVHIGSNLYGIHSESKRIVTGRW